MFCSELSVSSESLQRLFGNTLKLVHETKHYVFYRLKHKHITHVYFQVLWKCGLLFRPFTILVAILEFASKLTVDGIELTTPNGVWLAQDRVKKTLPEIWTLWSRSCNLGYYLSFNQQHYILAHVEPVIDKDTPRSLLHLSGLAHPTFGLTFWPTQVQNCTLLLVKFYPTLSSLLLKLISVRVSLDKNAEWLKKKKPRQSPVALHFPPNGSGVIHEHSAVIWSHTRLRRDPVMLQIL